MKKMLAAILALAMSMGMVSCGDSGDSGKTETTKATEAAETTTAAETEKPEEETTTTTAKAEEETTTTTAEPEVQLNTDVVHAELKNNPLAITASFDIANIEGFKTQESEKSEDTYRATGSYGYPDPEWYANAISVSYTIRPISASHMEKVDEAFQGYEKVDIGSEYETYQKKSEGSYGDSYDVVFFGGSYLDGGYVLELNVMPQLDSAKQEDVDLIVDTFAKSLKLEADDSIVKRADDFDIGGREGITCKNKATVSGVDVDMEQLIYTNDNCLSAQTEFEADGIGYRFYTYSVDGMDHFGAMGGGEYADCTFAGKPGKIKVSAGVGTLSVDADVQIDDKHCLHMAMESDSALQQGELADAAKLGEKISDMLSDENIDATREVFAGYISDIVESALTFPDAIEG